MALVWWRRPPRRPRCAQLRSDADEVVCATTPEPFRAVGTWYDDFSQTSDEEVRELLARAEQDAAHAA